MNSNARASVTEDEVVENLIDNGQSDKESKEHEPREIITDLDFFGAFSLVNVQLQWRDMFADLNDEESDSEESLNPNELFVDAVDFSSIDGDNIASTPAITTSSNSLNVSDSLPNEIKNARFSFNHCEQSVRTIAFIQNCGTYPKS